MRRSQSGHVYTYEGRTYARFEGNHFRWPYGYQYRRYAVSAHLPRVFWVLHNYIIDDYAQYGLTQPSPDFAWIRYGPDILLVSLATGEIIQVVYDAFDETDESPAG